MPHNTFLRLLQNECHLLNLQERYSVLVERLAFVLQVEKSLERV